MTEKKSNGDNVTANIKGDISGQVAVGKNIKQEQTIITENIQVTEAELDELKSVISDLKEKIKSEVSPDMQNAATERIEELEKAITEEKPDLTTMEYVQNWFVKNLPSIAGGVTSLVIHPIVGKLVQAGGDALVTEFNNRFGSAPK